MEDHKAACDGTLPGDGLYLPEIARMYYSISNVYMYSVFQLDPSNTNSV